MTHRSLPSCSLGPSSPLSISNSIILQTEPWVLSSSSTGLPRSLGPSRKGGMAWSPGIGRPAARGRRNWFGWLGSGDLQGLIVREGIQIHDLPGQMSH